MHELRFIPRDYLDRATLEVGDVRPELVLQNAHDGTRVYRIDAGLYRLLRTPPESRIIVTSRTGRYALETMLFEEGFVLDEGSPAARILERLTREGHALSRPAGIRD